MRFDMGERVYKCDEVLMLLGELVLDIIADEDREVVERHLAGCPSCAAELEALRALYGAMEPLELARPDPGFERRVAAGVRRAIKANKEVAAAPREERPVWWRIPGLIPGLAVVTAAGLTVIVFFAMLPLFGGLLKTTGESEPSLLTAGETSRTRDIAPEEAPLTSVPETPGEEETTAEERGEVPAVRPSGPRDRAGEARVPTAEDYWAGEMAERETALTADADDGGITDFDAEYLKAADRKDVFQRRLAAYWAARRDIRGGSGAPSGYVAGVNGGGRPPDGWSDPRVEVDLSGIEGGDEAVIEYTTFDDGVSVYFVYEAPPGTQDEVIDDLRRDDEGASGGDGR
jgi:hypothetical protein